MNAFRPEESPMTPEEAQAVVRRHLEAIPPGASGPNVADVAEALGVPPARVAELLDQVREAKAATLSKGQDAVRRWALLGLAVLIVGTGASLLKHGAPVMSPPPTREPFTVTDETGTEQRTTEPIVPSVETLMPYVNDMAGTTSPVHSATPEEVAKGLESIAAGTWDGPGMFARTIVVRHPSASGKPVRWIRATLPFYGADDPKIEAACLRERERRLAEAIQAQGSPPTPP